MNISKRTIIILVVGLVVIVGAFFSLYMEKESEIKELSEIEPKLLDLDPPVKRSPKPKVEPGPVLHKVEEPVIIPSDNGTEPK